MIKKRKWYRYIASFLCIIYAHTVTAGFIAGTLVKTPSGFIPIEQLHKNSAIECLDTQTNSSVTSHITHIFKHNVTAYKRIIIDNECINVSLDHLFYLPVHHIWVQARDLVPTDLLQNTHNLIPITSIHEINEDATVYDITVANYHNFSVSHHGIIVHNIAPVVTIGLLWTCGGGIEFAGLYGGVAALGVAIGVLISRCKSKPDTTTEHKLDKSKNYTVEPIIAYQPSYSNQPINITPTITNPLFDSSTTIAHQESALTSNPEKAIRPEDVIALMAKNKGYKKPKQEKQLQYVASCGAGDPHDNDNPDNNEWWQKKEFQQYPNGKYKDAPYHHQNSKGGNGKGAKSPSPINGQAALDNSIEINPISKKRLGISAGQIVELRYTSPHQYHGFVLSLNKLEQKLKILLEEAVKCGKIRGPIPKQ